jgi:hypothetical protein
MGLCLYYSFSEGVAAHHYTIIEMVSSFYSFMIDISMTYDEGENGEKSK